MKINKEAARAARQLFRACVDASGLLHGSRAKNAVKLLAQKKPRHYLATLSAFKRLIRLEVGKRTATIESVAPLSAELSDKLRSDLKKKYGGDLAFEFLINPELIGGLRVKVGSHVWDGSIRAKLQNLGDRLA
jgi:F-type H+-transporting ATPase subunit delta